jgi:hypothetical protein
VQRAIRHFNDKIFTGPKGRTKDLEQLRIEIEKIDWAKPVALTSLELRNSRDHVKSMLPIIQAYAEGSKIKYLDTVIQDPAFDCDPSSYSIVQPRHKAPPKGQSWHNPQKIAAKQIPDGHKLLTKQQFAALENGPKHPSFKYYDIGYEEFRPSRTTAIFSDTTYVVPDNFEVFISPPPPQGFHWHHKDTGWTACQLPPGFRPLIEGETPRPYDQMFDSIAGEWAAIGVINKDSSPIRESIMVRTKRPLPTMLKEIAAQREYLQLLENSL